MGKTWAEKVERADLLLIIDCALFFFYSRVVNGVFVFDDPVLGLIRTALAIN